MRSESDIADLVEHLWTIVEGVDGGGVALRKIAIFILDGQEAERDAVIDYFVKNSGTSRACCVEAILNGDHHVE